MSQPQQIDLSQVNRSNALYERPPVAIADEPTFRTVKSAIESSFATHNVEKFLRSLERASLRIRDFEAVLNAGKLGVSTAVEYKKLTDGDQGQIREFYLASLEQVEPSLRDRYFKLYAYY
jgi:hypothetical protein